MRRLSFGRLAEFSCLVSCLSVAGALCAEPTPISDIQGPEETSAMVGEEVFVEAVVTADFRKTMKGFFVQEEQRDWDPDESTSEGIFVFYDKADVQPGQLVQISGKVAEYKGQTQLSDVTSVTVTGTGTTPAASVGMPVSNANEWERFEGMLVKLPGPLYVAETYQLGRYGQMTLSFGDRPWAGTAIALPGEPARGVRTNNQQRSIILDDGRWDENPQPVPFVGADGTIRSGDGLTNGLEAIVTFGTDSSRTGTYRILPTKPVQFERLNPRPASPPAVGGKLKVASANVLNFFNGDGAGGGFPTPRGAKTPAEFARQKAKLVNEVAAIDADIVGFMEMENDGYDAKSALAEMVSSVNAKVGEAKAYEMVQTDFPLGTDAIRVAMMYRKATVKPVGKAATTNEEPFGSRRPPLAQTFEEIASGEKLTVIVNHYKSKGSGNNAEGGNKDSGDGAGAWNQERTEAAKTELKWIAADPTGTGTKRILMIGDFNANTKEDPIRTLEEGGLVDLSGKFANGQAYSFIYSGERQHLDYAFATPELVSCATGAAVWHINCDEPTAIAYDGDAKLFNEQPFRASDHDPVIVGLELKK